MLSATLCYNNSYGPQYIYKQLGEENFFATAQL